MLAEYMNTPPPKFFRCETCGYLVTDKMIQEKGKCNGHRLRIAFRVSFFEWLLIKLHIIQ